MLDIRESESFQKLLKEMDELTENNNHNESVLVAAKYFGFNDTAKIMEHIKSIHSITKGMDYDLIRFREKVFADIVNTVELMHGKDTAELVRVSR